MNLTFLPDDQKSGFAPVSFEEFVLNSLEDPDHSTLAYECLSLQSCETRLSA